MVVAADSVWVVVRVWVEVRVWVVVLAWVGAAREGLVLAAELP